MFLLVFLVRAASDMRLSVLGAERRASGDERRAAQVHGVRTTDTQTKRDA